MGRRSTSGAYTITSPGITQRVDTSAPTLGAAISKAQTLGGRLQSELRATEVEDGEEVTLRIRRLGSEDVLASVVVQRNLIATAQF